MAFFSGGWSSLKAAGGRYLGAVLYNKEQNQTAAYATLLYLEDLVESRQGYLALHFAALHIGEMPSVPYVRWFQSEMSQELAVSVSCVSFRDS